MSYISQANYDFLKNHNFRNRNKCTVLRIHEYIFSDYYSSDINTHVSSFNVNLKWIFRALLTKNADFLTTDTKRQSA